MTKQIKPYSEFGFYISRIATLLDKRGDVLFRKQLGISLRQFLLLRLIEADNAVTQQDIADRLGIAKSAVSRHINVAQGKGWLEAKQSTISRRQNDLSLTNTGSDILARAKTLLKKSEQQGFDDIPEDDFAKTLDVLRQILSKLQ